MEGNSFGLHLAFLHVDFVAAEHDGNVLTDTDQIALQNCKSSLCMLGHSKLTMPVRDVLVGNTGGHIKHDDAAISINVVAIPETAKLLLSSSIPDVELNLAKVLLHSLTPVRAFSYQSIIYRCESQRMDFDTQSRDVLFLELASQMSLDEGGLG